VTPSNGETVEISQLYITAVIVNEAAETPEAKIQTRPAIYLWNQPQDRLNTLPAWEDFHIVVE
jgi:hypothetical protein